MKKFLSVLTCMFMVTVPLSIHASEYNEKNIPIGKSNPVYMFGTIQQTIMSVTMPSTVPFDISKSISADNKVLSPKITIKNKSNVPVAISIGNATVDVSKLKGTTWVSKAEVGNKEIAIGLKNGEQESETLDGSYWIKSGVNNAEIMTISANATSSTYVVGAIGKDVPEEVDSTFSVTPIFMVKQLN